MGLNIICNIYIIFSDISENSATDSSSSEDEDLPMKKKSRKTNRPEVPFEKKLKIVKLAEEHPDWSLESLRKNGASCLLRKRDLIRWKQQVLHGGSKRDMIKAINEWVYQRFIEARATNTPVCSRHLQEWAVQRAQSFIGGGFEFSASHTWLVSFKNKNRIRQRAVTRYLKPSEKKPSLI